MYHLHLEKYLYSCGKKFKHDKKHLKTTRFLLLLELLRGWLTDLIDKSNQKIIFNHNSTKRGR